MHKIYYLSTCSTCKRIMKDINIDQFDFEKQDIKTEKMTVAQVEEMHQLAGSYEALFSKRSRQYGALGLKEMDLSEDDLKGYILQEYSFLKRPVFIINGQIFVGNSKKNVEAVIDALNK